MRNGRQRDIWERKRARGLISSEMEPERVGKERYMCWADRRSGGRSFEIRVLGIAFF